MTADGSGLIGTTRRRSTIAMATVNNGQGIKIPAEAACSTSPHVDARRIAQNTNDLRGKLLRITVKRSDIARRENELGGA